MPVPALIAGGVTALGGTIAQGAAGVAAANRQRDEMLVARAEQQRIAQEQHGGVQTLRESLTGDQGVFQSYGQQQRDALTSGFGGARQDLGHGFQRAVKEGAASRDIYREGTAQAMQQLAAAHGGARQDVMGGFRTARGDIGGALGQAQQTLQDIYGRSAGAIQQGLGQAVGQIDPTADRARAQQFLGGATTELQGRDVTGARSRLEEFMDQGANIDLESNPAYQARRSAALEAADMSASAQGGRGGSAAERRRMEVADRLASEEYERAYGRKANLASGVDRQRQELLQSQAGREQRAGLSAQQNQAAIAGQGFGLGNQASSQLANLYAGAGTDLANIGAGIGQQAANIYQGAGQNMANLAATQGQTLGTMGTNLGTQQAALTSNQMQGLAGVQELLAGLNMGHGQNLGNLGTQYGTLMSNQLGTQASNIGQALMGAEGMAQNIYNQQQEQSMIPVQFAGGDLAALGNMFGGIANLGGSVAGTGLTGVIGGGGKAP